MHQPCSGLLQHAPDLCCSLNLLGRCRACCREYTPLVEVLVVTTCNADMVHRLMQQLQQCRGIPKSVSCMPCTALQWSQCHNANIEPNYRCMQISV